jgi:predicted Zn-dependent peptidase
VFEEIDFVKQSYIASGQLGRIRSGLTREYEENSLDNGYLLNQIARHYSEGLPASPLGDMSGDIASLTGPQIQDAAKKYLGGDYVKVVLMPAK